LNQGIKQSSLSPKQAKLVRLMQGLNFGRIEGLLVKAGEPIFEPPPRLVRKVKIGGENGPRPEISLSNFNLKQQTIEMLAAIAEFGDGEVLSIEVKHGLPFALELQLGSSDTEPQHG
jgi:hypothetical protein